MATISKTFEDLKLLPGALMHMATEDEVDGSGSPCVLAGCLTRESLIVIPPESTGVLPGLIEGQYLNLRIAQPDGFALIKTQVLYITEVPALMVYLDFPSEVSFELLRAEPRVQLKQPVLGYNKHHPNTSAIVGSLIDISFSGAGIQTEENLGKVGEKVTLKSSFKFADIQKTLAIDATIKRLVHEANTNIFGLSFGDMADDQKVFINGFIHQKLQTEPLSPLY